MSSRREKLTPEQREQLLDLYQQGQRNTALGLKFNLSTRYVSWIVGQARAAGDPRVVSERPCYQPTKHEKEFTPEEVRKMDEKFSAAMLAAIKAGTEHCLVGRRVHNRNDPFDVPRTFYATQPSSYCGSPAGMCAEIGWTPRGSF